MLIVTSKVTRCQPKVYITRLVIISLIHFSFAVFIVDATFGDPLTALVKAISPEPYNLQLHMDGVIMAGVVMAVDMDMDVKRKSFIIIIITIIIQR
uniref:Uncharacterized protein n=1 Tax=Tetranychus urticae TaxID=32264 RepID=T1KE77_TETUR